MNRIQTLGGLAVLDEKGRPLGGAAQQPRRLAVVAVLARGGDRGVNRDRLAELLWPDLEEERARKNLNQALYALRHDLGTEDAVLGTRDLRFNPELVETDLARFETAVASGALEEAARQYTGPFLDDYTLAGARDFARWADEERTRLAAEYRRVLEAVAVAAAKRGDWGSAVLSWRRLAALDPGNARVAQGLMRALAAAGDVPGATRHAEIFTELRAQEFDLPPDPDVLALAERLRRGELPPVSRPSGRIHEIPDVPDGPPAAPSPSKTEAPRAGPAIAVLPFVNMSPDRENEYFSDGLTEELTNALAQVAGLRVASRGSAFSFKGRDLDAREVGARLGVTMLVEGSVRTVGNRIRVTAQIVSAKDGFHLWSQAYDRTMTDVFELQDEIARAIVAALGGLGLGRVGSVRRVSATTTVVDAYTLYLKGRYFSLRRTSESLRIALEHYDQALQLDPRYALAAAGQAECWTLLGHEEFGDMAPLEVLPRAKAAALRALELDPLLAEGHLWRGVIALMFDRDPPAAEAELDRAVELNPRVTLVHLWRAILFSLQGRNDRATAAVQCAEAIDPLAVPVHYVAGVIDYFADRYDAAQVRFQTVVEMNRESLAAAWSGRLQRDTGHPDLAHGTMEAAMARLGRQPPLLEVAGSSLAALGRHDAAREVVRELEQLGRTRYVSQVHAGYILAALGDTAAALDRFEAATDQWSPVLAFAMLAMSRGPMRGEPRLQALLSRLHHPLLAALPVPAGP
jgi:TolB-like protein/DNA-binding SARP family transcriptional activator/Tfp pilus assembly protein PilF